MLTCIGQKGINAVNSCEQKQLNAEHQLAEQMTMIEQQVTMLASMAVLTNHAGQHGHAK